MNESLHNLETIRQYLLGRISDESMLEGIEELLFADEDFCTKAEIVEDELINDFVFGKLNAEDKLSFEKTLENNADRHAKVKVTQLLKENIAVPSIEEKVSFFDSIKSFFRQPIYAGGFALLIIAILIGAFIIFRPPNNSELAELKNIYQKNRPTESRISEFDYAPYEVTRGENDLTDAEKRKLKIIENDLLKKVDGNPNANNHNVLGIFYLSQRKYSEAIKELEESVKLESNNARFNNDLGSAYFELGRFEKQNKLLSIAKANESFSKAIEQNPNLLEAIFNKGLALQELNLPRQAKETWELYLQKDSTSKWANEARKNLEKLAQMQSSFKTKEQVLQDFLTAYRNKNEEFAWKINSQTKEMISGVWLPDQLSRRYLQALKQKDGPAAKESIEALTYIGNLEEKRNADFFVRDLADYYAKVDDEKIEELLKAKDLMSEGYKLAPQSNYQAALESFKNAEKIFVRAENLGEKNIASYWIAFCLTDKSNLNKSLINLQTLDNQAKIKNYKWFRGVVLSRIGDVLYKQNETFKALSYAKESFTISQSISDTLYQQRNANDITLFYLESGELNKTFFYLSKLLQLDSLFYQSSLQNLRNVYRYSDAAKQMEFQRTAIDFVEESAKILIERKSDKSLIFDSNLTLAKMYSFSGDNEKADYFLEICRKITDEIDDAESKKQKTAYLFLQGAEIERFRENFQGAKEKYDLAIKKYEEVKEFKVGIYSARKGRLICLSKLNLLTDFEKELGAVSGLFEENRQQILEDESRSSFFDSEQSLANIVVNFYVSKKDYRQAFNFAENSKARSLLDLIEGAGFYDDKKRQIVFKQTVQPYSIEQIQSRLSSNVQLVQYAVLEDKIAVWLISNNQFEVFTTPIQNDLFEQKVKDYLDLIKNKSPNSKQISKELFDILIKPILAKLDKSNQICIVPDGILYHLPFASLVSSDTDKYLVENFTLFYSPSASISIVLSEIAKNKPKTENLLAIGNPEFNRSNNPNLQNLESAENEATEISKFYENPKKLIKKEAVKSEVLANFGKTNIFHFAGHYVANPNSSLNSKLLLTQPDNSDDEFVGELRASEILQTKNPNLKLAVLSACETGIEKFYKGEGAIGMARTFLAVGTPIVVASQWKVETESTSEMMKSFHRNRKEKGLITSEALRQAQLEMITNKQFSEPYFWSAFSAIGGSVNY